MAGVKKAGLCYANSSSFLLEGLALDGGAEWPESLCSFLYPLCECSSEGARQYS